MIYIDYEAPGGITDVGFVYTAETGDDTPFQLELPAHNPGDAIFVWARGTSAPGIGEIRNASDTGILTLTSLVQVSPSFGNGLHLMWGILPSGSYEFYGAAGTAQVGIHIYRGVSDVGAVGHVYDVLDNFGGEIPGITLEDTSGDSRIFCGVLWNQVKASVSTPTGLTKRLTSPTALGGGTGVSYDTTEGVASFSPTYVDAFGGAYYQAWAIEMKV